MRRSRSEIFYIVTRNIREDHLRAQRPSFGVCEISPKRLSGLHARLYLLLQQRAVFPEGRVFQDGAAA